MTARAPEKKLLFEQFAVVGKALGHPNRLDLLEFLAQGERTVEELARLTGLSVANTSQHLQHLRRAGLVRPRKVGQHVHYDLTDTRVVALLDLMRGLATDNLAAAEQVVDRYYRAREEFEGVPAQELMRRMHEEAITILDVRPPEEFHAGHLPGAINVPLTELTDHLPDLPLEQEVVAYCRGPYCLMGMDAVAALRARGYNARRLNEGLPEWRAAGGQVISD